MAVKGLTRLLGDFFDQEGSLALWAGSVHGAIPKSKRTGRVFAAGVEGFSLFRPFLGEVTAASFSGAFDPE